MTIIEIKSELDQNKIKMVIDVLKALGISATVNKQNVTKMTKEEFVSKIERARKSSKIKVSVSEQARLLGL